MSIWYDTFDKLYRENAAQKCMFINEDDYVDDNIVDFVGTREQVFAEEARLKEEAKQINKDIMKKKRDETNKIVLTWLEMIKEVYSSYPKIVYELAYGLAYEQGHSSGYGEVENYLHEYIEKFNKAYEAGYKSK